MDEMQHLNILINVSPRNRAKQCSLGQTDARDGQDCVSLPGIAGGYRKVRLLIKIENPLLMGCF